MAVCTVIVRRHIDGHHGDDRLAVDGVGAVVVGRKFGHDGDLAFGHAGEVNRLVVEALDLRAVDVEVEVPLTLDVRRGCSLGSNDEVGRVDRDVDAAGRVGLDTDAKGGDVGTLEVDGRPVVVIVNLMIATGVVVTIVIVVVMAFMIVVVVVFLVDGLRGLIVTTGGSENAEGRERGQQPQRVRAHEWYLLDSIRAGNGRMGSQPRWISARESEVLVGRFRRGRRQDEAWSPR